MGVTFRLATLCAALAVLLCAPADAHAASVKGTWLGTLTVSGGVNAGDSLEVIVRITRLRVGRRSGHVFYPDSQCEGPLTLARRTRTGAYVFQYRETGGLGCTGDDRISVRPRDGGLFIRVIPPVPVVAGVAKGLLHRTSCAASETAHLAC